MTCKKMWIVYLPTLLFRATQHILLLLTHIACACGGGGRTNILFLSLWTMQRSSSCTKLIYTLEQRFEKIKRVRQCEMTSADMIHSFSSHEKCPFPLAALYCMLEDELEWSEWQKCELTSAHTDISYLQLKNIWASSEDSQTEW